MKIIRLNSELCGKYKDDISSYIYKSMNRGCDVEIFTLQDSILKVEQLRNYLDDNKAYAFIAMDKEVDGFAWAYPYGDEKSVYLSIIYVNELCRGKCVGHHLIKAIELAAKNDGYCRIWLHTDADNTISRRFYAKNDYVEERIQSQKYL